MGIALALVFVCACSRTPETLVTSGYDEQEMESAIARARAEVDAFIAELGSPSGEDHSVKAPIEDNGETEHFWLTDVVYRDGKFEGLIGNDPGLVTNVKLGDKWTVAKEDISDWMYMRDGMMHGNYTMRPLLVTLPKEQADAFRAMFAVP
jgi:uncharacterized protein YegJ (DUF2314 family)